jgi:hypothetical protein
LTVEDRIVSELELTSILEDVKREGGLATGGIAKSNVGALAIVSNEIRITGEAAVKIDLIVATVYITKIDLRGGSPI